MGKKPTKELKVTKIQLLRDIPIVYFANQKKS